MTDTPKVRALFERARNLPLADRLAFVLREAGDDADLANEVLSLLGHLTTKPASPPEDAPDDKVSLGGADPGGEPAVLDAIKNRESPSQRYRHVDEIARGGMGKVSQVRDLDLRRQLAMKVMLDEQSGLLPRFVEEAQVMGQLDHPNIVPVHELGFDAEGRVFFTMKLVKGETLRDVFERVESGAEGWNVTRALSVILRVCEALAFAHAKGVIHRDIKPGNIMVGRFGEVYVMDWGLARVLGHKDTRDLRLEPDDSISIVKTERQDKKSTDTPDSPVYTMDGAVVGTPSYMPPEQAEGFLDLIGPRSDVYAVGALLYRLLSGRDPYSEPGLYLSGSQIVLRVIAGPPQPLHELAQDVPAKLLAIQEKAMARRIDDRYPSMTALANDLQAYLEHRVVSAYETGAIAELKKWVERNQGLAAAAALLVCVLAGATAIVLKKNQDLDQKNVEILAQKTEVENQKHEVEQRGAEVAKRKAQFDQLAGVVKLENARLAEKALYPAWPEKITAMDAWLRTDAQELLDLNLALTATLAELESFATKTGEGNAATFTFMDPAQGFLHSTLTKLGRDIGSFETTTRAEVEERLAWAKKIGDLTLHHPNAKQTWDEAHAAIARADDLVASKLYAQSPGGPIDLKPQTGLVPIGMNPVTKLWEFYELRSACDVAAGQDPASLEIPAHRDDGSIEVKDGTGLVLVLLPGGTFLQGAQKDDPNAPNYDPGALPDERPQEATLAPFFLARHELTAGQWKRLVGDNPSQPKAGLGLTLGGDPDEIGWSHPVNQIDWDSSELWLRRYGLTLPTDVRWEYGARGGTTTPWWTGTSASSLSGSANVFDLHAGDVKTGQGKQRGDFDDGYASIAPVGQFRANAFGLFDVYGNVSEWCLDVYVNPTLLHRNKDEARAVDQMTSLLLGPNFDTWLDGLGQHLDRLTVEATPSLRASRGGASYSSPASVRSAHREWLKSTTSYPFMIGARPARDLAIGE